MMETFRSSASGGAVARTCSFTCLSGPGVVPIRSERASKNKKTIIYQRLTGIEYCSRIPKACPWHPEDERWNQPAGVTAHDALLKAENGTRPPTKLPCAPMKSHAPVPRKEVALPSQTADGGTVVRSLLSLRVGGALGKAMRCAHGLLDDTANDDLTLPPNGLNIWKVTKEEPTKATVTFSPNTVKKITSPTCTASPAFDPTWAIKQGPARQAGLSLTGEEYLEAEDVAFNLLEDIVDDRMSINAEALADADVNQGNLVAGEYICMRQAVDKDGAWVLFSDNGTLPPPSACGAKCIAHVSVPGSVGGDGLAVYESDNEELETEAESAPTPQALNADSKATTQASHTSAASTRASLAKLFGCMDHSTCTTTSFAGGIDTVPQRKGQELTKTPSSAERLLAGCPQIPSHDTDVVTHSVNAMSHESPREERPGVIGSMLKWCRARRVSRLGRFARSKGA